MKMYSKIFFLLAIFYVGFVQAGTSGFLPGTTVADGSITAIKLASDSVTSAKIVDGTITGVDVSDNSLSADKLDSDNAPFIGSCAMYSTGHGINWGPCGSSGGGGSGDVVGPASSVDNFIPLFDGVTGKLLSQSDVKIELDGPGDYSVIMPAGLSKFKFDNGAGGYIRGTGSYIEMVNGSAEAYLSSTGLFLYAANLVFPDPGNGINFPFGSTLRDDSNDIVLLTGSFKIASGALRQETTLFGTGDNSLTIADTWVVKTAVSGAGDRMTLPDATVAINDGAKICIKDGGDADAVETITIDSAGGNIDGGATKIIINAYGHVCLFVANAQWYVESESL